MLGIVQWAHEFITPSVLFYRFQWKGRGWAPRVSCFENEEDDREHSPERIATSLKVQGHPEDSAILPATTGARKAAPKRLRSLVYEEEIRNAYVEQRLERRKTDTLNDSSPHQAFVIVTNRTGPYATRANENVPQNVKTPLSPEAS